VPRQFGVPEELCQKVMAKLESPRAYSPYFSSIHKKHIIGINNAYQVGDWIDILFFGDASWYHTHAPKLAGWPGLKASSAPFFHKTKDNPLGVKYLARDGGHKRGISNNPHCVSWNGNSGAAAISLAAHLGVRRIVLLGFDMKRESQLITHWHGNHKSGLKCPFTHHLLGFPEIAKDAKRMGIEILNASPESALKAFPRVLVKDLL
jgi:hypothetical protein